jgi:branched-subunit amino acid ABC-type transport system permease component
MNVDYSVFLTLLFTGISRGMIYFLLSAGLSLIFGVLDVVNFAHGVFYMIGVFICYTISKLFGFAAAFIATPLIMFLFGGLIERTIFRRVYSAHHVLHLLLSVGFIYITHDVIRMVWGVEPKSGTIPMLFRGFIEIIGIPVSKYNIFIFFITLAILALMLVFYYKTKWGSITRACVIDRELASCAGINVSVVFSSVFAVGMCLAGIASVTAYPVVTAIIGMDSQMIIVAFIVVVIGGPGSVIGAFIAALTIGIIESVGIILLPRFAEIFMYLLAIAVLLYRPQGLFSIKST